MSLAILAWVRSGLKFCNAPLPSGVAEGRRGYPACVRPCVLAEECVASLLVDATTWPAKARSARSAAEFLFYFIFLAYTTWHARAVLLQWLVRPSGCVVQRTWNIATAGPCGVAARGAQAADAMAPHEHMPSQCTLCTLETLCTLVTIATECGVTTSTFRWWRTAGIHHNADTHTHTHTHRRVYMYTGHPNASFFLLFFSTRCAKTILLGGGRINPKMGVLPNLCPKVHILGVGCPRTCVCTNA